jgi:hypothetical protein
VIPQRETAPMRGTGAVAALSIVAADTAKIAIQPVRGNRKEAPNE